MHHARAARRHVPLPRPAARHQPALIGALLALSFATKESTFITVFVAGTFFHRRARGPGAPARREAPIVRAVAAVGWEAWGWALAASRVFTLLFTVFLTTPPGCGTASTTASTTGSPSTVGAAASEEWYFYIVVLFAEEWPALLLGAVGAVATLRRPDAAARVPDLGLRALARGLLVGDERFAWLVLHPLLPLLLLAGLGVQAIWEARRAGPAGSGSPSCVRAPARRATRRGGRTSRTAPTRASSS